MRIDVTEADIREGKQDDPSCCAVALAIKRACPRVSRVQVDSMRIDIDGHAYWRTTLEVHDFVESFDEDKDQVRPFSFELPV